MVELVGHGRACRRDVKLISIYFIEVYGQGVHHLAGKFPLFGTAPWRFFRYINHFFLKSARGILLV